MNDPHDAVSRPRSRSWSRSRLARTSAWLLGGVLALAACGTDGDARGSLSLPVDPSIVPAQAMIGDRPVGRMVAESGVATDFFLGELIVSTDDRAALDAFVARWGATIVESTERIGDHPRMHKLKLDPSRAVIDELVADLNGKAHDLRGSFRSSSEAAAKLLAIALTEANAHGMTVTPNFVMAPDAIGDGRVTEAPSGESGYSPNAFDWTYMNRGSAQDVGVGAAWQAMARAGVFRNKVKMMILDGGFSPTDGLPTERIVIGDWNVPNPGNCGGSPCPWHGTHVANVAMGTMDDGRGTAGPAAPIAQLIAVPIQLEFFRLLTTLERIFVGAAVADIINVSSGFEVDIGWDVAVKIACLGLCPSPTEMASGVTATIAATNKLIFASAGNSGRDVDGRSNPEGSTTVPCELAGVVCVGGMANDATALYSDSRGGSNFGTKTDSDSVDIYGPYWTWIGTDPDNRTNEARLRAGTSFSSPFVAGVAALVWASRPSLSAVQVWEVMRDTAHVGGVHPGGGHQRRINAFGAVARVLGGAPPSVTTSALSATAPLHREWSVSASVSDDGGVCPPTRCPLTWSPAPSRVSGNLAFYRFDTAGRQTVTVTAQDPVGQIATATHTVDVVNAAPVVAISSPSAGASVAQGVPQQLLGSAIDENEGEGPGPGALTCRWTSSNASDPFPANGCNLSVRFLSQGARTLTLSATDPEGQTSSATVTLTVTPPPINYPPTVTLTTTLPPFNYDSRGYQWMTPLALSATATDPEGNNPVTYEWVATSFRPNSTVVFASNVTIGSAASFTWTPSTTPSLFGTTADFGNDCYHGQIVRVSVRARDSLGNTSAPVNVPDVRIYRCTID